MLVPIASRLLSTPVAVARRLAGPLAPSPLRGRTVLVTGASSGIGEATARACAERGATVLLVARRPEELERVRLAIVARGGRAEAYACDLTEGEAVDALVKEVLAEHGVVDHLVNNAGRSIRRSVRSSFDRMHDFERTMAVNYFGPVRLTLGLLPAMVEQRRGHVVNVVTWGVQVKSPKFAAYIASKTALDSFARIAGRELLLDGVTFTNVRLGLVRTPMIGPTEAYRYAPALSAEQAADRLVRAMEDRPVSLDILAGRVLGVFTAVAPVGSDLAFALLDRALPESRAARGDRPSDTR